MKRYVFLSILFLMNIVQPAYGQLLIDQGRVIIEARASDTIADSVTVHNTDPTRSIYVKVYWEDFEYTPPFDGSKKFYPPGSLPTSMGDWVSFSPKEFLLKPKDSQQINYTMRVSKEAKGGYYGVMFFEIGPEEIAGDVGVKIVQRVGSLFLFSTKDKRLSADLKNFNIGNNQIVANLENTGDVVLVTRGVYYTMDSQGFIASRGVTKDFYMAPKGKADFLVDLSADKLSKGDYTTVVTFDLGEGKSLVREVEFYFDGRNADLRKVLD